MSPSVNLEQSLAHSILAQGMSQFLLESDCVSIRIHLTGARFRWKKYYGSDHDHCGACWETFSLHNGGDYLKDGYAVTADYKLGEDYEWVCAHCFNDLKDDLGWTSV
jgi:hypothetical protein